MSLESTTRQTNIDFFQLQLQNLSNFIIQGDDADAKKFVYVLKRINLPKDFEKAAIQLKSAKHPYLQALLTIMLIAKVNLPSENELSVNPSWPLAKSVSKINLERVHSNLISSIFYAWAEKNWPLEENPAIEAHAVSPALKIEPAGNHELQELTNGTTTELNDQTTPSDEQSRNHITQFESQIPYLAFEEFLQPDPSQKILSLTTFFPKELPEKMQRSSEGKKLFIYRFPLKPEELFKFDLSAYTEIDLSYTQITDQILVSILNKTALIRSINLNGCISISGRDGQIWQSLEKHPIHVLEIVDCENLCLEYCRIRLNHLIELNLIGLKLPLNIEAWLSQFPNLKTLKVSEGSLSSLITTKLESRGITVENWKDQIENPIDYNSILNRFVRFRCDCPPQWIALSFTQNELDSHKKNLYAQYYLYSKKMNSIGFQIDFDATPQGLVYADMHIRIREEITKLFFQLSAALIHTSSVQREEIIEINSFSKILTFLEKNGPFPSIDNFIFSGLDLNFFPITVNKFWFPNLKYLDFSKNRFAFFPEDSAFHFSELIHLDLSSNQLIEIPNLVSCFKLVELNLENNKIEKVDFSYLPIKLKKLNLKGNPILKEELSIPKEFFDLQIIA
jgi:hypothetical protein